MILRAKFVVPVSLPPIEDGAIVVRYGRIAAIGKAREILRSFHVASVGQQGVRDLGNVALLPGLINAHCHLDYTSMAGKLWPSRSFLHWLEQIVTLKRSWDLEDYLHSWRRGEEMLRAGGVTTVANMEVVAANLILGQTSPLRLWSFLELINIGREKDSQQILASALAAAKPRHRVLGGGYGLCPHALYTASGALIREAAAICRKRSWPLTIHLAESREEWEMFRRGRGLLYERFRLLGRDMRDCGTKDRFHTPTRALARLGVLGKNLLVAHANYVTDDDIILLARHRVSVVHCPKSHAFFGHRKFPIEKFLTRGVNVCLGTDSMASNDTLDMLAEMHALWRAHPGLRPGTILTLATANGARALRQRQNCGVLLPGRWADLMAVPIRGGKNTLFEQILQARSPVRFVMIGGKEQSGN